MGTAEFTDWIRAIPAKADISLYLHVPFCRRLCWFCACRTQGTSCFLPVIAGVKTLQAQLCLRARHLPAAVKLSRLHWGGGTPTLMMAGLIRDLAGSVLEVVPLAPGAEFSVGIDAFEILPEARPLTRVIARRFDAYTDLKAQHSAAI